MMYLSKKGKTVYGVLMMTALCSIDKLYEEALKGFSAGVSKSAEMKDLIEVSLLQEQFLENKKD